MAKPKKRIEINAKQKPLTDLGEVEINLRISRLGLKIRPTFRNPFGSWVAWSCDGNAPTGVARRSSSLMTLRLTFQFQSLKKPQKRSASLAVAVAPLKVVPLRSRETNLARFGPFSRQKGSWWPGLGRGGTAPQNAGSTSWETRSRSLIPICNPSGVSQTIT